MRSYLLLLAIGLLWGSQFIFMHQAVAELPPILVAAGRALCGSLTLGLLCLFMRLKSEHTPWRTYMLIALLDATLPSSWWPGVSSMWTAPSPPWSWVVSPL